MAPSATSHSTTKENSCISAQRRNPAPHGAPPRITGTSTRNGDFVNVSYYSDFILCGFSVWWCKAAQWLIVCAWRTTSNLFKSGKRDCVTYQFVEANFVDWHPSQISKISPNLKIKATRQIRYQKSLWCLWYLLFVKIYFWIVRAPHFTHNIFYAKKSHIMIFSAGPDAKVCEFEGKNYYEDQYWWRDCARFQCTEFGIQVKYPSKKYFAAEQSWLLYFIPVSFL